MHVKDGFFAGDRLQCDAPVSAVAADFFEKLKGRGWKEGPGNLTIKTNVILKRERDGADLTIMEQTAGTGCTVKIFTRGLDWLEIPAAPAPKPAKSDEPGDVVSEADRLIRDALKQIPGGF